MSKKCGDPICPVNKDKSKKKKTKKPKKESAPKEKKSEKPKERPQKSKSTSCTKSYKNKKCQVSKSTVDSSTSPQPSTKSRGLSTTLGATICHCHGTKTDDPCTCKPRKKSAERKRKERKGQCRGETAGKIGDHTDECAKAHCICVRREEKRPQKESKNCKCADPCTALSKDVCCCIKDNGTPKPPKEPVSDPPATTNHRLSDASSEKISKGKKAKCVCEKIPQLESIEEKRSKESILKRAVNSLRRGCRKMRNSMASTFKSEEPEIDDKCAPCEKAKGLPRCPTNCSMGSNCADLPMQNRCQNANVKKKVRISK